MDIDWQRLMMGEMMVPARTASDEQRRNASADRLRPGNAPLQWHSDDAAEHNMAGPSRARAKAEANARPPLRTLDSSASFRSASQNGSASRLLPLSSSPMPSGAISPQHSSDNSSANASQSRRKAGRARRSAMNVKVLYTLDSNPRATMVAYFDQPAAVDVVALKRRRALNGQTRSMALFGKITLKACLRAVCSSSPELVMDSHKDFVLYAADPIESFRASQRQQSGLSRQDGASPSKSGSASAFMVGKGFLSRALAENEEGVSFVHGRVRSEYADDEDEESSDDEDDGNDDFSSKLLEVSLRLKEAPVATRSEFEHRVRALQTASDVQPIQASRSTDSVPETDVPSKAVPAPSEARPVAATTPQEQLLQLLQALQSQSGERTSAEAAAKKHLAATATSGESIATDMDGKEAIAKLLRTLNATAAGNAEMDDSRQNNGKRAPKVTKSSPAPPLRRNQTAQAGRAKASAPAAMNASSPILGGLTPGYDIGSFSAGASPAYSTASAPAQASTSRRERNARADTTAHREPSATFRQSQSSHVQCCYNCGETSQSSWQLIEVYDEDAVRFRAESAMENTDRPQYRACDNCADYFNKYAGNSRPEYLWQKDRLRVLGDLSNVAADSDAADDESPDAKGTAARSRGGGLSRTLSAACARDSERMTFKAPEKTTGCIEEEDEEEEDELSAETTQVRIRRSAPARKTLEFESARMKDYVLDAEGNWRTKRSIVENPEGRRPGRPKGIKTGEGFGRTRIEVNAKRKAEQNKATKKAAKAANVAPATSPIQRRKKKPQAKAQRPAVTASSPVRPSHSAMAAMHCKTPAGLGKLRYGAPTYLLDSSPATALQTVMDEADTDWKTLFAMSPRRSPRKNPSGVHAHVNPYASMAQTSPIQKHGAGHDSLLMNMTSSSPLTRGRVRSGNFDWAFNSSDDILTAGKLDGMSSLVTSPSSPSPSRAKPGSAKRRHNAVNMELEAGTSAEIQERAAKRQKNLDISTLAFPNGEGALTIGEEDEVGVPGSPTLGRSQRLDKKKRSGVSSRTTSSPSTTGLVTDSFQQPSDVLNLPNDWVRNSSMRDLFPWPSPSKSLIRSPSRVSWESPTAWALRDLTPSPQKPDGQEASGSSSASKGRLLEAAPLTSQVKASTPAKDGKGPVHRKPLPATVEDATPSDMSQRSPAEEDDEDIDEDECALEIDPNDSASMAALMEMFDDSYGLLKASGLASASGKTQANMPVSSDINTAPKASTSSSGNGNGPHIELFKSFDFARHMDTFKENGQNGVAARVDPVLASTLLPVPNAPVQIEGNARRAKTNELNAPMGSPSGASANGPNGMPSVSNDEALAMWLHDNKLEALWDDNNAAQATR